jgi:hypothetical protein
MDENFMAELVKKEFGERPFTHKIATPVQLTGESCPYTKGFLGPMGECLMRAIEEKKPVWIIAAPVRIDNTTSARWGCPGPFWMLDQRSIQEIYYGIGSKIKLVCGHLVHID